jgi:tRNA pseudouridine38-40 synthase
MVARYRATLAYDGSIYVGFQRQAGGLRTIQGEVESAIAQVTGQQVTVVGAGRTDTGVHAEGQVIAFDVEWRRDDKTLMRALNATLPEDIALQDIRQHEGFHPRFDAVARIYRYTLVSAAQRQPLLRKGAWRLTGALDDRAIRDACECLLGRHDFGAFGHAPQGDNTVREVYRSEWVTQAMPHGKHHVYHIEANAFLQHMVRRIVGMLVEVGRGRMSVAIFQDALANGVMVNGVTLAPPQGLVLESVRYPSDEELQERRGRRPSEGFEDV